MLEQTILANLVFNEDYMRKVIPFLKDEYFEDQSEREAFNMISKYISKYAAPPSSQALKIELEQREDLNEQTYQSISQIFEGMKEVNEVDQDWLIDSTERFCQDRAIYNAVRRSIFILDGKDKQNDRGAIPQILSDALAVSFDNSVGHDFLDDSQSRFEFYHTRENKIPFDLEYFNNITKGGVSRKSLIVALAGTGVGKTLFMTHCAAAGLSAGLNVLYITMEMAEERIAERVDANLMDVTIDDLHMMVKESYDSRIARVKQRTRGKLIIKEYPTAAAGAAHFRHLLNELKIKKNFKPDIIFIDYLNICCSTRMKLGGSTNSYTYIKAIAEELRGLGVEFNVPIFTATQTNRDGYGNTDVDLTNTSESFGLPATADMMFALISTEELEEMGQLMVKQLKNRWGDINNPKRFVIGIDRPKMRLFNLDPSAQDDLMSIDGTLPSRQTSGSRNCDRPVMDNTGFGERYEEEFAPKARRKGKANKPNFGGLN